MKKNNLLKTVLLFVFAVLLLGCRQEADVLSQKNAQSNNNAIKMVSLSDIPQVTSFIKNKTGRKDLKIPFKNRNTHKLASISPIETIDLETNIIVEKVEDDIKYYVFNIDNIGDDKTIYNLEIKAVNGIVNDLKVVEYASTTSLAGDTNLKLLNFTGTVSTYNLDGTYRSSVNYIGGKGDCPNPEEPIYPSDPSNPTSPIDGSGSGSGGGLYDSGSPSDPSSGFDGGGSWWINYGGSSGNTRGNDGSNTSGDGAGGDGSSSGTPPSTGCNPNSYVFLQDVISNGEVVGKIYINDCGVKVFRSVLVSGGALRLSGDCGSGSGVILLDELDLKFEKYIRSFLAIDKYNYLNLPENEEFRDGLKQYYANNVGQPNLQTFLSWAVDFKNSNPNTSWTQFQNWFIEGDQDFNRDLLKMIVENNHKIPQYTSSDFPGMNNGMPYNWWNDENYLNNMSLGFNNINLTKEEKKMCALFPLAAVMIFSNKDIALNEASSTFPNQIPRNNKADAFRHAFFNALNIRDVYSQFSTRGTFTFAKNIVRMFGIAHESEVPQELLLEKAMDLYNNEGGIEVCSTCNPLTNPTNLVKGYVLSLLNEGKLVHIWPLNNDQTIRPDSNIYPTNQH